MGTIASIFSNTVDSTTTDDGTANDTLNKIDFLNLLVTQMQNQDPLDPMDNEQFVAQMAQFSQLEQMINLNDTAETIKTIDSSINNSQAVNLIGKEITVQGNSFTISDGVSSEVTYSLEDDAAKVSIDIYDENGDLVRNIVMDGKDIGRHDWSFDGLDNEGNILPDGQYSFTINASDADDNAVAATTFASVTVDGLSFENGIVYLKAAGGKFRLSDVVEVNGIQPVGSSEETEEPE